MNNNQPSSFATLSTRQTYDELCLMLKSIEFHHKNTPVFVVADSFCQEHLEHTSFNLELKIFNSLDLYSNLTRFEMEEGGIVTEFWNNKTKAIEWALDNNEDVMFLDCDVFVVSPVEIPSKRYLLGLSPQFIPTANSNLVGFYNGGYLWTRCKKLPSLWRRANNTSRYVDQASLEAIALTYKDKFFEFDEGHNIQPWRAILWEKMDVNWYDSIMMTGTDCFVNYKSMKSIHTHFHDSRFKIFNTLCKKIISHLGNNEILKLIDRIESRK